MHQCNFFDWQIMSFQPAQIPNNDNKRVEAVHRADVIEEIDSKLYEIFCFLAKEITGCPVSWTGVIDSEKQVMLARDGFPDDVPNEMPRNQTLCQFALERKQPLVINNMVKDTRFRYHPAVTDFGVRFYAAFPIVTSDGYTLGTLCVSDNKVRKLTKHKISLLMGLAKKLAYQLEVQVSQRKGTAESTIHILNKLLLKYPDLKVLEAISVLKFIIKDSISLEEQKLIVKLCLGFKSNNGIEISSNGKLLKKELNLNIGTLKRVKNLSSNEDELMNMLGQIKG